MKHCRVIYFDLFATLINVGRVPEHVGRFTADILGVDRKLWNQVCFGPLHEIRRPSGHLENLRRMAHSLDETISEERIREAVKARQARFDYALVHCVEAHVLDVLRQLRDNGYRLGLISNASTEEVLAWPRSPLAELFDATVFSCATGLCKPETGIYQHALSLLGEQAENCLFIGDGGSQEHIGAFETGMIPWLVSHYLDEEDTRERLERYQHVLAGHLSSLQELLDILGIDVAR